MKRLDDGKVSLVEFMRSIKFAHNKRKKKPAEVSTHFAQFDPQARPEESTSPEDRTLVRSGN